MNQPNLQAIINDARCDDHRCSRVQELNKQARDAIHAAGLSAIGEDESVKGAPLARKWNGIEVQARNALKAEQRKAWQWVCYGDET